MLIFCIPPLFPAFSNSQVIPQLPACLPPPILRYLRGQHGLWLQWPLREYWLNPMAPSFPFLSSPSALPAFATGLASEQRLFFHLIPTSGVAKPGTNMGLQAMSPTLSGSRRRAVLPCLYPTHVRVQELACQTLAGFWEREGNFMMHNLRADG